MIEKLAAHYKDAFSLAFSHEKKGYKWYKTDEGQVFGILSEAVTEEEENLLATLYTPYDPGLGEHSERSLKWLHYLYGDGGPPFSPLQMQSDAIIFSAGSLFLTGRALKKRCRDRFHLLLFFGSASTRASSLKIIPSPLLIKKASTSGLIRSQVTFSSSFTSASDSLTNWMPG